MKTTEKKYFIQITKSSGEWFDVIDGFWNLSVAEVEFRKWCSLNSNFFFVRLVIRSTETEEILLDHIDEC